MKRGSTRDDTVEEAPESSKVNPKPARRTRELRVALAMRGGVSLAVWMGGACREVARLREHGLRVRAALEGDSTAATAAGHDEQPGTYERLLQYYSYDSVGVDVLAGTSAGGLNGALMAAHLVYGMPFDHRIRDIWLQVGHLEILAREPDEKSPPSLLRGDDQFYRCVLAKLESLITDSGDDCRPFAPDPVRLILTATRLTPRDGMVRPRLGPLLPVGQSRAHFRFRHRGRMRASAPGGPLSDFGRSAPNGDLTAEQRRTIECLAYAARTTSSFPGAFEPARPFVKVPGNANTDPTSHLPVDFRGVSSETGSPDDDASGCVELIDGGVLDNIPIAWAVRAIAAAPSDRPVDRWLLYLQPVPPLRPDSTAAPVRGDRRVTRLLRLLRRTQKIKTDTESLLDDADEMRRVMVDVRRRDAVAALAAAATDARNLVDLGAYELSTYRVLAGGIEADRFVRLLEDPIAIIGPDPLPLTDTAYPLRKLDDADDSQDFFARIRAEGAVKELAHGPDPRPGSGDAATLCLSRFRSPMAAARTATLLLDWVKLIEDKLSGGEPDELGSATSEQPTERVSKSVEWRRKIYAARFAAEVLVAARDRVVLALARSASSNDHPVTMLRSANARIAAMVREQPMPPLEPALDGQVVQQRWEEWAEQFAEKVVNSLDANDTVATVRPYDCDWRECELDELWRLLASVALDISQARITVQGFRGFVGVNTIEEAADRLWAAEILIGPSRIDTLSDSTEICLATVSAANVSPLEDVVFGALRDDERVSRKLSGNQVANFASFLSARWRAADWTWGRLDAAQSLVAAIARPERAPAGHSVENLKEMFTAPPAGRYASAWRKLLEDRWNERQDDRDRKVTDENLHERTVELMTERLQWEILAEELPVISFLHHRSARRQDTPPASDDLARVSTPNGGPPQRSDLLEFGRIGDESVVTLLPKPDLRRSLLRLGLVGWRAMQPSGTGWKAGLVQWGGGLTIKPLAWLPILFAITAPWPSMIADILVWLAVVETTGQWVSLPATPVLLLAALVSWWLWAWQFRTRRKRGDGTFPTWPYGLALIVTLLSIAAVIVGLVFGPKLGWPTGDGTRVLVVTGLLTAAVFVLVFWILGVSWRMLAMLITAIGSALLAACFTIGIEGSTESVWDWSGLVLIAVPLLVVGLALTYFFPKAPTPD